MLAVMGRGSEHGFVSPDLVQYSHARTDGQPDGRCCTMANRTAVRRSSSIRARVLFQAAVAACSLPAPPREQATAREDQAGYARSGDWAGDRNALANDCGKIERSRQARMIGRSRVLPDSLR